MKLDGKKVSKNKNRQKKKTGKSDSVNENDTKLTLLFDDLGVDLYVDIYEDDTSFEELWELLNVINEELFDMREREIFRMIRKELRVSMPRELENWTTNKIDDKNECIHCNCNRCNFGGRCMWVSAFETLQFDWVIDNLVTGEGLTWNKKVLYSRQVFPRINIDIAPSKLDTDIATQTQD